MNIEISGAGSNNKGALLMLYAVIEEFKNRKVDARFGVDPMELLAFEDRAKLNIRYVPSFLALVPSSRLRSLLRNIANSITFAADRRLGRRQADMLGMLPRSQSDMLIDISGYRYGDYWHVRHAKNFASIAKHYNSRGKPVILLPQMFGPFERPEIIKALKAAFSLANLIYARELESYSQVQERFCLADKLLCAPDITIKVEPCHAQNDHLRGFCEFENGIAIVPNFRIVKNSSDNGSSYRGFLKAIWRFSENIGLGPAFLIHDASGEDRLLAREVLKELNIEADSFIIEDNCPLSLKAILSRQKIIVSSRYHACVSGLSSGVPVLSYGWAHKYKLLHKDFLVEDWILTSEDPVTDAKTKIENILSENKSHRQHLLGTRKKLCQQIDVMWDQVFELLRYHP